MLRQSFLILVVFIALTSAVSLKSALQPTKGHSLVQHKEKVKHASKLHDEPEVVHHKEVLNDDNSHEPLYKEMSTEDKVAAQQEQGEAEPIELPYGTKISVPGLPPGSRMNPGGITPKQRNFDRHMEQQKLVQDIDEDAELSAERTLAEDPGADVGTIVDDAAAVVEQLNSPEETDCLDCENVVAAVDAIAEKMDAELGEAGEEGTTATEDMSTTTTTEDMSTTTTTEDMSTTTTTEDMSTTTGDEGYSADGYGDSAVPEDLSGDLATTDDTYAEGYEEGTEEPGNIETEMIELSSSQTVGAGVTNTEFLEIASSFTAEKFLARISDVDAPLPSLLS